MTDKTDSKEREVAEQWLRDRYGAYRGHFAWRELEEAFLAGRASLAASAGSEPVAVRDAIAHFRLTHWADEDGGLGLADALSQLYGEDDIGRANEELDALADAISEVVTHPSPPEGMVGGWIASKDQMPPPGVRVFWGDVDSHRVGYDSWAGDDYRWAPSHWMHIPEFPAPPTTSAGSGKGE